MCIQDLTTGGDSRAGQADEPVKVWHPSDVDPFATFADDGGETVSALYADHRAHQAELGDLVRTFGKPGGYQIEVWVSEDRVTLRDLDRYGAETGRNVICPEKLTDMGVTAAEFAKAYEKKTDDGPVES